MGYRLRMEKGERTKKKKRTYSHLNVLGTIDQCGSTLQNSCRNCLITPIKKSNH